MPTYEFKCMNCGEEFVLVMSLKEREEAKIRCPKCNGENIKVQLGSFYAKTSKKS